MTQTELARWLGLSQPTLTRLESEEAKRLLRLREGQVAEGRFPGLKVERIRFNELAEDYLTDYRVNGKKSLERAERSGRQLKKHFGGVRVVDITTSSVTAYIGRSVRAMPLLLREGEKFSNLAPA